MSDDDRDERDKYERDHDDREYLTAVADHEPAGTTEIAEAIGVTRQNADRRLRALEEEGAIRSKKVGNSLAWTLAEGHHVVQHVDPTDDFWEAPTFAGEATSATDVDDVL